MSVKIDINLLSYALSKQKGISKESARKLIENMPQDKLQACIQKLQEFANNCSSIEFQRKLKEFDDARTRASRTPSHQSYPDFSVPFGPFEDSLEKSSIHVFRAHEKLQ